MNTAKRDDAFAVLHYFLSTPLDAQIQRSLKSNHEAAVCSLFHTTAAQVPAYKAFLAEHNFAPNSIRAFADIQQLPPLTKENYLRKYSLPDLCRNGKLEDCDMIAVSSGSTGTPCFWPRFVTDELQIAWRFEQIFHDSFRADERKTLAVICFALGTWVGGMYTAACCRHLAAKGYPITVITPGNNKYEILRVVQELGGFYDQVVLCGYPPFLKDVVDTGISRGVDWPRYHIKMVMAGEVFSEEWRDLVGSRVGSTNPCYDSSSLYGTADAGVLGNETPLSICIRRFLSTHPEIARALFGASRLPTLVQYDPLSRYFEVASISSGTSSPETDGFNSSLSPKSLGEKGLGIGGDEGGLRGQLLFSGDNGIPLIRYNILDQGGVVAYEEMLTFLATHGFDPVVALGDVARGARPLPFVFVFGRSDFTVSFFGANIYPENITVGLEQPEVSSQVTGKFVLQALEDTDHNRFLSVTVELAPGVESDENLRKAVAASIRLHLLRLNSEFANYVPAAYQFPIVTLMPHGAPAYFPIGVKHRYTRIA